MNSPHPCHDCSLMRLWPCVMADSLVARKRKREYSGGSRLEDGTSPPAQNVLPNVHNCVRAQCAALAVSRREEKGGSLDCLGFSIGVSLSLEEDEFPPYTAYPLDACVCECSAFLARMFLFG